MAKFSVKFWLRWLFRVAVIVGILGLVVAANLEGIGGWLLKGRLESLGLGDVHVQVHTIALDHAIVGPIHVGKHALGAEYVRVDFATLGLRDAALREVTLTGVRIPVLRTADGWEVDGLEQLLALRDPNSAPVVIPVIRVESGTLALITDDGEMEIPFTAVLTTSDAVTWTAALTLRPAGDRLDATATINTADGSGPVTLTANRLHPERHLELVELALGEALPPMVLRGDGDVSLAVTLADYQPTAETLAVNLREARVMLTEPTEGLKDAMAELSGVRLDVSRPVGGTQRRVSVTAQRVKAWGVLREPPAGLEGRIDAQLDGVSVDTELPVAGGLPQIIKTKAASGRVESGKAFLALTTPEVRVAPLLGRVAAVTRVEDGAYLDYQLSSVTTGQNLTFELERDTVKLKVYGLALEQPERFKLQVVKLEAQTLTSDPTQATGRAEIALAWLRQGDLAMGPGTATVVVSRDRVMLDTPGLPVTYGAVVAGTVTARELAVSYPAGRPLSGEVDLALRSLAVGPVTVAATRLEGRIEAAAGERPELLVVTAADIPLTVSDFPGAIGALRLAMPNAVDFGAGDVGTQVQAQAFGLTAERLSTEIREVPLGIEQVRVVGRLDRLRATVQGIASERFAGISASGTLRGDATRPLSRSVAEFRVSVDPAALPLPEGWALSGQPHDLAVRLEANADDPDGHPLAATLVLPAGDAGRGELETARGMSGLSLQAFGGQVRGTPRLRLQVRRNSAGEFSGDLAGGIQALSVALAGVEVTGGDLTAAGALAGLALPGARAALPESARLTVGFTAESLKGYGMAGAATADFGLALARAEDQAPTVSANVGATLGTFTQADITVTGIAAALAGQVRLPQDSGAEAPVEWKTWLSELKPLERSVTGRASASFDYLRATEKKVKIKQLAVHSDYSWSALAGFAPTVTPDGFTIASMYLGKVDVLPLSWPVTLEGRELSIAGGLTSRILEATVNHKTTLRLLPQPSLISAFSMPPTELEPRVDALKILLNKKFESLTGTVDFNGRFVLDTAGAICEMAMTLDGVSFSDGNSTLENIAGTIEFDDILTMRSKPSQVITFDAATVGPLFFGHGDSVVIGGSSAEAAAAARLVGPRRPGGAVTFRTESATSLFLESCDLMFLGGRMQAHALRYDPSRGNFTVTLYGDDLHMQELLGMIDGLHGTTDAKLFAKLVINHDGRIFDFGDGYIYLLPGQDARLHLTDFGSAVTDKLDAMKSSNPRMGLAVRVLENLEIHDFRLNFIGDRTAEYRIRARLRGQGTPDPKIGPVPLDYKLNIGGAIREAMNFQNLMNQIGIGGAN